MYSFLVRSAIKPESSYDFYTYLGKKPIEVSFRGKPISITKGMKFGVRPGAGGKAIRLVFPGELTKVITLDLETAQALAKYVGPV